MKHDDPKQFQMELRPAHPEPVEGQFGFGLEAPQGGALTPGMERPLPGRENGGRTSAGSTHKSAPVAFITLPSLTKTAPSTHDIAGAGPAVPSSVDCVSEGGERQATPTRAMAEVLALRWRQINQFGHTPEADLARALHPDFSELLRDAARSAREYLQFNKREIARRYLVKLAALSLATIDRIDAEDGGPLSGREDVQPEHPGDPRRPPAWPRSGH